MNNKTRATLVAFGVGMVEGVIGSVIIKKHLEAEGWVYDKSTNQYVIHSNAAYIKQAHAEQYKTTVYAVVGVAATISGLVVREVMK